MKVIFSIWKKIYIRTLNIIYQFIYRGSINYLQRDKIWRYVALRKAKDQKDREKEKAEKDCIEHGVENRRADVSGELVRGLLGTTLTLGRVITRFVSRKPPGSTQMRTATENAIPSRHSFCDNPMILSLSLFPCPQRTLDSSHPLCYSSELSWQNRTISLSSLYSNITSAFVIYWWIK